MADKKLSIFERYLTIWVLACITCGIIIGKVAPGIATTLIVWIAIPLLIQIVLIFAIGYFIFARWLKLTYHDAAPAALIGASNHFEVAIATAVMLFGLSSGAALATVVGVLIEVPVMLMLVAICTRTCHLFRDCRLDLPQCKASVAVKIVTS